MPSIQLHADKYEALITRRGRIVKWEEAILCSCWNIDSGQPQYSCAACNGKGYLYAEPVEDVVLLMSITHNKEFQEMAGVFEVGDAVLTVGKRIPTKLPSGVFNMKEFRLNPIFHIGMNDKITLLDDTYKTSEVLIKGEPMYGRPADTLLNEDVTHVKRVQKSDPSTGIVTTFTEGEDFDMDGNRIVWLVPNSLEDGEQYSVTYEHRPVFIVFTNLPTPRHQDGQDLPKKVALRYRAGGLDKR